MALIEDVSWHGEPIKAVIHIDDSTEYTVYTDDDYSTSDNFIKQIKFSLSEGNNRVNPLGVSTSNTISLQVYDKDDALSPMNTSSKYYGKIVNGIEIEIFISYDGVDYSPFGKYYTTSWGGSFSDGWHGLVDITAEDRINSLGNRELPELQVYQNIEAGNLIASVMYGLKLTDADFTIDPRINKSIPYGIVRGGKVRDFLNNICQLLLARVIVDRDGVIRFVPALEPYNNSNECIIDSGFTGSFKNKNNSNIDYNKVAVKYLEAGDTYTEELFSDSSHSLIEGSNKITDINFKHRALSIKSVRVLSDPSDGNIASLTYRGFQSGIEINIDVTGGPITNCNISGVGLAVSTTERVVSLNIDRSTRVGGRTFEFDTQQMMSKSDANNIASNLVSYISKISRNILLTGSALTPKLYLGDKLTIQNTDTMYDGVYKIIGLEISMGENYSLDATLIRIE